MEQQKNGSPTMEVGAFVAHEIPGRIRLKVPAAKGRPDLLQQLSASAAAAGGVQSVAYNPASCSLTIHFASGAHKSATALGSALSDSRLHVSMHTPGPAATRHRRHRHGADVEPSVAARKIASFFKEIDTDVRDATDNELDLRVVLPLAVGTLGLLALRRTATTPLWLTLLIFAFNSFLSLHGVAVAQESDLIPIGAGDEIAGE